MIWSVRGADRSDQRARHARVRSVVGAVATPESSRSARTAPNDGRPGEVITTPRTDDATWAEFWTLRDTGLGDALLPCVECVVSSVEEELEGRQADVVLGLYSSSVHLAGEHLLCCSYRERVVTRGIPRWPTI
jgi:hypothetical protein